MYRVRASDGGCGRTMLTNEHRFAELYRQHADDIYRFVLRRISADAATDVVSQVFTTAWRRFDQVVRMDEPLPWLYTTARYVLANERRSQQRQVALVQQLCGKSQEEHVGDHAAVSSDVLAVAQAFDHLAPADQEVLRLIVWENLTSTDAAAVLGISRAALAMRLSRARRRLIARLMSLEVDERSQQGPAAPLSVAPGKEIGR
jgi:RNA polymerase sigma factor (sigma-70 family)